MYECPQLVVFSPKIDSNMLVFSVKGFSCLGLNGFAKELRKGTETQKTIRNITKLRNVMQRWMLFVGNLSLRRPFLANTAIFLLSIYRNSMFGFGIRYFQYVSLKI